MNDLPTGGVPWRILIYDPEPGDAKWLLATIAGPDDVRPASPGETELDEVAAAWLRARNGQAHTLTAMPGAWCWRVDGGSPGM